MLRISRMECEDGSVRLQLEGRLVAEWVDLLGQVCEAHRAQMGTALIVDMSAVSYADREGRELLAQLSLDGARIIEWSAYLRAIPRNQGDRVGARTAREC